MKTSSIALLVGVFIIGVLSFALFMKNVNVDNKEIDLREDAIAQETICKAFYDKMWKIFSQQAQVSEKYKDSFKEIYIGIMEGRYSKGDGSLMKWIQESNPNFNDALYQKLMNNIEIQREGFFNEQSKLIDIKKQHDLLMKKFPSKLFIDDDIKPLDIKIITSTKTEDVYKTGKEDDVNLY